MTALGKLLRTTAFQLTLVYLVVFALFAAFLVGYFAFNTRRPPFVRMDNMNPIHRTMTTANVTRM